MSGDLLMRTIDHRHLAFHEAFERRVAEPACQRKDMVDAFFMKGARQQMATTDVSFIGHWATPDPRNKIDSVPQDLRDEGEARMVSLTSSIRLSPTCASTIANSLVRLSR